MRSAWARSSSQGPSKRLAFGHLELDPVGFGDPLGGVQYLHQDQIPLDVVSQDYLQLGLMAFCYRAFLRDQSQADLLQFSKDKAAGMPLPWEAEPKNHQVVVPIK